MTEPHGPHPHAVPLADPLETEKLIVKIVETASMSWEECKRTVDALTGDQIVAIARAAHAFMPSVVAGGPNGQDAFLKMLVAAMQGAASEWITDQLLTTIQTPGMTEPRSVRIVVVPDEMRVRFPKRQPLGRRGRAQHGG